MGINFNESIQKGAGTVTIHLASQNSVVETIDVSSAQVSLSGSTATINPSVTLLSQTAYYVQIGNGVFEDLSGNAFAGISDGSTWNSSTEGSLTVLYQFDFGRSDSPVAR